MHVQMERYPKFGAGRPLPNPVAVARDSAPTPGPYGEHKSTMSSSERNRTEM